MKGCCFLMHACSSRRDCCTFTRVAVVRSATQDTVETRWIKVIELEPARALLA